MLSATSEGMEDAAVGNPDQFDIERFGMICDRIGRLVWGFICQILNDLFCGHFIFCNLSTSRGMASDDLKVTRNITSPRGSLPTGAKHRATALYPVDR